MKNGTMLAVTSLLSILLFSIHWADDVVRGLDSVGLQSMGGVVILLVWLTGTLILGDRRSGLVIALLGALFSLVVMWLHLRGPGISKLARAEGAFPFIWTLFALGTTGAFAFVLAVRGLWASRAGAHRGPTT
jgi:hypothetical protein